MSQSIGVGFLGGGPATQAIHLPILALMADRFHAARVMDVNPLVADKVAARAGAKASTVESEIYDDPDVEVVVVCSPNQFHASQVLACCLAGKRLVLCEKPLATSVADAESIACAATLSGTQILVGTMHVYDPAWRAAQALWQEAEEFAHLVRSSIYLPGNDQFIDQATEQALPPSGPPRREGDQNAAAAKAARLRGAVLGLAIHDVPLLRQVYPNVGTLHTVQPFSPFGYALSMSSGEQFAELSALMPGRWPSSWRLQIIGRKHELDVEFTPSYVLAGSARAVLSGPKGTRIFETPQSGYEAMWAHAADILAGAEPLVPLEAAVADLVFALDLVDGIDHALGVTK